MHVLGRLLVLGVHASYGSTIITRYVWKQTVYTLIKNPKSTFHHNNNYYLSLDWCPKAANFQIQVEKKL